MEMRRNSLIADAKCAVRESVDIPWFPRKVSDLDCCRHLKRKDDLEMLASDHPGFTDQEYRKRRGEIAQLALNYKGGTPLPHVFYNEVEKATWRTIYTKMKTLHERGACREYKTVFNDLERMGFFSAEEIPQLDGISRYVTERSGFSLRPVAGLVSARDFLASLALKVFQCTQYVRHHSSPMHTPEPDCCHELLGHVPMLCEQAYADFSQEIGLASLGASDEDITKLASNADAIRFTAMTADTKVTLQSMRVTTFADCYDVLSKLYWFTVEFGVCKRDGEVRAYGAGILSAYGELEHVLSGVPEFREFDAESAAVQPYEDTGYQPVYFFSSSFLTALEEVRRFAKKNIKKTIETSYNPLTHEVEVYPTTVQTIH